MLMAPSSTFDFSPQPTSHLVNSEKIGGGSFLRSQGHPLNITRSTLTHHVFFHEPNKRRPFDFNRFATAIIERNCKRKEIALAQIVRRMPIELCRRNANGWVEITRRRETFNHEHNWHCFQCKIRTNWDRQAWLATKLLTVLPWDSQN